MLRDILSRFHNIFLNTVSRLKQAKQSHNNIHWAIQLFTVLLKKQYSQ